jgi:hypothetical protein
VSLADATGLAPDEFVRLQKTIVTMRNNLIEWVHAGE